MNTLAKEFAALAECLRLVAGGLDRLVARMADNPAPFPLPPDQAVAAEAAHEAPPEPTEACDDRPQPVAAKPEATPKDPRGGTEGPRWTAERIALIRSLVGAVPAGTRRDWRGIAAALTALPGPEVTWRHASDWWAKVGSTKFRSPPAPARKEAPAVSGPAQSPRRAAAAVRKVQMPSAADEVRRQAADQIFAPADAITIRSWAKANGVDIPGGSELGVASLMRVNARREREGLTPFRLIQKPIGRVDADELERMRVATIAPAETPTGKDAGAPAPR